MNKLKNLINSIPYGDKIAHFIAGFIVSAIASIFFKDEALQFGMALLVGGAKEFYDNYKYNHQGIPPFLDWGATMLGGIVFVLIF